MELAQLRHFLAAVQHGSLRRAAYAADISQPALTKSIHRLEARLGVRLFERHARGVRPTVFGEAMVPHAMSLTAELRHMEETMREIRSSSSGLVRVGAGASFGVVFLPSVTEKLLVAGPAIRLHVRSGQNDTLLAGLQHGDLDFAITTTPTHVVPGLVHRHLFVDNVVVVARSDHPLLDARASIAELASARWIMPRPGVLVRDRLSQLFSEQGIGRPDVWIETDSVQYTLEAVARTNLLAYMPDQLLRNSRGLTILEIAETVWRRSISLSCRRNRTETAASRLFLSVIRGVARDFEKSG